MTRRTESFGRNVPGRKTDTRNDRIMDEPATAAVNGSSTDIHESLRHDDGHNPPVDGRHEDGGSAHEDDGDSIGGHGDVNGRHTGNGREHRNGRHLERNQEVSEEATVEDVLCAASHRPTTPRVLPEPALQLSLDEPERRNGGLTHLPAPHRNGRHSSMPAFRQAVPSECFQELFENDSDAKGILGQSLEIVYANRALRQLAGISEGHAPTLSELLFPDDPAQFADRLRNLSFGFASRLRLGGRLRLPTGLGRRIVLTIRVIGRNDSQDALRVVEVAPDSSEPSRIASSHLHSDSVDRFAIVVVHELKNLVGASLLAAETALASLAPDFGGTVIRTCLDNVIASMDRCTRLVARMRQFRDDAPLEYAPLDLNRVVTEARNLTRFAVAHAGGVVELALASPPPIISASQLELEMVLVNLIQNAIESRNEPVWVRITTKSDAEGVHVIVEDDGSGMTEDQKRHVFDPFFTTRAESGGIGLGMAIVRDVVKRHGGSIRLDSAPGAGTLVEIRFPRHDASCAANPLFR